MLSFYKITCGQIKYAAAQCWVQTHSKNLPSILVDCYLSLNCAQTFKHHHLVCTAFAGSDFQNFKETGLLLFLALAYCFKIGFGDITAESNKCLEILLIDDAFVEPCLTVKLNFLHHPKVSTVNLKTWYDEMSKLCQLMSELWQISFSPKGF